MKKGRSTKLLLKDKSSALQTACNSRDKPSDDSLLDVLKKQDFFLLASCIATALIAFIVIAVNIKFPSRGVTVDAFLDSVKYEFMPEWDIPIYIFGWMFITAVSALSYLCLRKYIQRYSEPVNVLVSKAFCSFSMFALFGLLDLSLKGPISQSFPRSEITVIFISVSYIIVTLQFIHPQYRVLKILDSISSWSAVLFVAALCFVYALIVSRAYSLLELTVASCAILVVILLIIAEERRPVSTRIASLVDLAVIFGIAYLVAHLNYNYGDYSYFLGPMNDILHGKTLLVDSDSQYGLLQIYSVALLFKLGHIELSYANFAIINVIGYMVGYSLIYVILRVWSRSQVASVVGLLVLVQQNYFVQVSCVLFYPQTGFLRFGLWIPLMLMLLIKSRLRLDRNPHLKSLFAWPELFLVSIAFFWGLDSGLYVLIAFVTSVVVDSINLGTSFKHRLFSLFRRVADLLLCVILTFGVIVFYTLIHAGKWPNWGMFASDSILYASGFGMIPMPKIGLWWLLVGVYFLSVLYVLLRLFFFHSTKELDVLAFISAYGILQFIYYVGRSDPNNLHHVFIPAVLISCWFFSKTVGLVKSKLLLTKCRMIGAPVRAVAILGFILVILALSSLFLLGTGKMMNDIENRGNIAASFGQRDDMAKLFPNPTDQEAIIRSIDAINRECGTSDKVAIISSIDTFFLIKTKKVNQLSTNNLNYYVLKDQVYRLGKEILDSKPNTIFVDRNPAAEAVTILKRIISESYHLAENVGFLDRWVLTSYRSTVPEICVESHGEDRQRVVRLDIDDSSLLRELIGRNWGGDRYSNDLHRPLNDFTFI